MKMNLIILIAGNFDSTIPPDLPTEHATKLSTLCIPCMTLHSWSYLQSCQVNNKEKILLKIELNEFCVVIWDDQKRQRNWFSAVS